MGDPTLCHHCRRSEGDRELPLVEGRPTCKACLEEAKGVGFPRWLKWAAAGTLALTCVSYAHAMRFILGYGTYRRAVKAYHADRDAEAANLMEAAARRIPEDDHYQALANFYRGWEREGNSDIKGALPFLRKAQDLEPEDREYRMYVLAAERRIDWEAGDYTRALKTSQAMMNHYGETEETFRYLASAQAANFAATGEVSYRTQALATLERMRAAKGLDPGEVSLTENWLHHRMATGEILDLGAFRTRFPQGWRPEGGE
jgi:tetratricopeptide (TPR) repeat protein